MHGQNEQVHIIVKRHDIAALPDEEEATHQWLHSRFAEKDRYYKWQIFSVKKK